MSKINILDSLKNKNISDGTLNLYIKNLIRLNDGNEIKNLNFLKNPEEILNKINDKSKNTQRTYLIAIVSLLKDLYTQPKYKKLYDLYYTYLIDSNNELKNNTNKSEKQKENWLNQDEINEIYNKIKLEAEPLLLTNRKKDANDKDWNIILNWFVLSLYTCQAPRRNKDYLVMYIVKSFSHDFDKQYNYYSLDDTTFHYFNFKTEKTYKLQEIKANDDVINNMNKYIINHPSRKEIKKLKNNVLIPLLVYSTGDKFNNNDAITRILNHIFNKKIGVSLLRSIFLTDKFKESNKEKEELTKQMGTSINTADNNYIKLD